MIANLTEVSIETIQDLGLRDYMKIQKWLQAFLSITTESPELRRAVLIMAAHAKGGVSEWLEMETDEFVLWLDMLKELNRDGRK